MTIKKALKNRCLLVIRHRPDATGDRWVADLEPPHDHPAYTDEWAGTFHFTDYHGLRVWVADYFMDVFA